jgi:hypothetical protein
LWFSCSRARNLILLNSPFLRHPGGRHDLIQIPNWQFSAFVRKWLGQGGRQLWFCRRKRRRFPDRLGGFGVKF